MFVTATQSDSLTLTLIINAYSNTYNKTIRKLSSFYFKCSKCSKGILWTLSIFGVYFLTLIRSQNMYTKGQLHHRKEWANKVKSNIYSSSFVKGKNMISKGLNILLGKEWTNKAWFPLNSMNQLSIILLLVCLVWCLRWTTGNKLKIERTT